MDHGLQVPPAGPEVAADLARGGMSPGGMPGRWHVAEDGPCGLLGGNWVGPSGGSAVAHGLRFSACRLWSPVAVLNWCVCDVSLQGCASGNFPPSTCKFDRVDRAAARRVDRAAGAPQDQFCGGAPVDK